MKRLSTGSAQLDMVLGGGFPEHSINLVTGMPGTGKTILAQRIVFANARPEAPALYFGTVSEPLDKILRYVQEFSFYDPEKIGDAVVYVDLSDTLRTSGLTAASDEIADAVREYRPRLLVIDSYKALRAFAKDEREHRTCLASLTVLLSSLAVTTFLVGEYSADEAVDGPEFAVADGVLELTLEKTGVRDIRHLRVTKLRGTDFFGGQHAFRITDDGLKVFPRVVTPSRAPGYDVDEVRAPTGVEGVDGMIDHGLSKGSATVVFGPPGSGKTAFGLHFLLKGIEMGEPGLLATLQENPTQLRRVGRGFGWDLEDAVRSGMLHLYYVSPVGLYLDEFVHRVVTIATEKGCGRIVVDSLNDLRSISPDMARFRDYMYSLTQAMAVMGVTLVMTHELRELFGTSELSDVGVSHMADNVLLLNYLHDGAEIRRTIAVVKARGSRHDSRVRGLSIGAHGLSVGEPVGGAGVHPAG